jgi:hypothetical protein
MLHGTSWAGFAASALSSLSGEPAHHLASGREHDRKKLQFTTIRHGGNFPGFIPICPALDFLCVYDADFFFARMGEKKFWGLF